MKDLTNGALSRELNESQKEGNPTLQDCLDQLKRTDENLSAETTIMKDFAFRSFYFERYRGEQYLSNGGIIYHGPHDRYGDGGAPSFSVSLDDSKKTRWEIHT